jgi:MFS transporter, MHS family, shikimate and dehydroshikimate transport protein
MDGRGRTEWVAREEDPMASVGRLDAAQAQGEDRQNLRKVVAASFIGTTIEWYDFFLYGTAAALVFGDLFFPGSSPLIGTLSAFGTFAVGFCARPLGGLIFGHFGDRIGRKTMLVTSLLIMGLATFLIGCLPTHATIGIWAPILLVVLRFAQGIGVGGEWGGAVLMSVEHAPKGKRGFYGSWPQMGVPAGLLLSTVVFTIVQSATSEDQFAAWGWRIPFLVSIVLVAVGLFVRLAVMESPAFREVEKTGAQSDKPIVDVVREHKRDVLTAMGMRIAENGCFYIFTVFVLAYGEDTLKLSKNTMLTGVIIAAALGLLTVPLYGALSDRFGRNKLYMAGAVFTLLFAYPFFAMLDTKEPVLIWLAIVLAVNVGHDLMYGPQAAYFSELFGTRVRYTGASIGYQLASVFGGGFAPLIAVALLAAGGGEPYLVALYMVGMGLITVVATYFARETYQSDIGDVRADEARPATGRFVRKPAEDRESTTVR